MLSKIVKSILYFFPASKYIPEQQKEQNWAYWPQDSGCLGSSRCACLGESVFQYHIVLLIVILFQNIELGLSTHLPGERSLSIKHHLAFYGENGPVILETTLIQKLFPRGEKCYSMSSPFSSSEKSEKRTKVQGLPLGRALF